MFLEPLQPNSALVTLSVVLLEHFISSWEDRRHVRVQLVSNEVEILRSIKSLLCLNQGLQRRLRERHPKHNTVYDLLYTKGATVCL